MLDYVVIEKGGDVIPKVVSVDLKKRKKGSVIFEMPRKCPSCGKIIDSGSKNSKAFEIKQTIRHSDLEKTVIIEDSDEVATMPTVTSHCEKCGHNEAFWILRQTRSSDEPETRIYTCIKCGFRWRAY